ncbi:hypothetical protein ISCGN_028038 [Ixodes scapularis]
MLDPRLCASGHFALADCLLGDQLVRLISVYAPSRPGERKDFFVGLRALLDTPATLVVGGDFNCVTNSRDRARLDRVYVSGEWSGSVVSYDAKIVPFSDHGFVAAEILAGGPGSVRARRDTPWKMNFSILESEDFIEETRRALQNLEEGGADAVSWEEFKIKLRDTACALGRRRGAEERQARIHLTNTLKALLEEEESSPGSFSDDIKLCKEHLLAMLEERYKGAQVRSRVETLEGETQPSKIFRTHERKRATENTIKELRQGARVFTSREDIAGVFETSFGELFREERLDDVAFEPFLRGSPSVPEGAVDILNCPIREAEVQHAIKHLSRNKAPGPDGIGSEFYKIFSDALCPILARVFNDIRRRRLLPPTMRQSFTVLIPKNSKKGPISEVGDFRPISLLCSDYKILAKILARRLDTGLKSIIGPHQTYGLRGRKISRNLMRAIGEATAEGHQPLAVLQLDLRQAFDRDTSNAGDSGYKMLLPPLPSGSRLEKTVFLHGEPRGRPYRTQDFADMLQSTVGMKHVVGLGAFQFNHVFVCTLNSTDAKDKLTALKDVKVKGRKCVVVDPNFTEVVLRVHWLPTYVTDREVSAAFAEFGVVKEITREMWKSPTDDYEVETSTRSVRIILKKGGRRDELPHQGHVADYPVLRARPASHVPPVAGAYAKAMQGAVVSRLQGLRTRRGRLCPNVRLQDEARATARAAPGAAGRRRHGGGRSSRDDTDSGPSVGEPDPVSAERAAAAASISEPTMPTASREEAEEATSPAPTAAPGKAPPPEPNAGAPLKDTGKATRQSARKKYKDLPEIPASRPVETDPLKNV